MATEEHAAVEPAPRRADEAKVAPGLPMPPDRVTWAFAIGSFTVGGLLLIAALSGVMGRAQPTGIILGILCFLIGIPFLHDAARPDANSWVSLMPSKRTAGFGSGPHSEMGRNAANKAVFEIRGLSPATVARLLQTNYPLLAHKNPQKRIDAAQMIGSVGSSMSPEERAGALRRLEPLRADPYGDVRQAASTTMARLVSVTGAAALAPAGSSVRIAVAGPGVPFASSLSSIADRPPWLMAVHTKSGEVQDANLRDLSPDLAGTALRASAKAAADPAPARRLTAVRIYGEMGQGINAEARASSMEALERLAADYDRKVRKAAAAALAKARSGVVPATGAAGSVVAPRDSLPVAELAPGDDEPPAA